MLPFELPYDTVDLFVWVTLLLMVLGLLGIGSIILRRLFQTSNQHLLNRHKELFVKWVIGCIHADMMGDEKFSKSYRSRLKVFVKGNYPRRILADVFQQFMKNLSEEYRWHLIQLYVDLGMDHFAIRAAKSRDLHQNIQAITEIRDFGISIDLKQLLCLMSSKHREVREETMYQLFDQHPELLKSLLLLDFKLSQWQKILIFQRFKSMPEDRVPDIKDCLELASSSARIFLVDMIGRLQLKSYFIKLLNMLLIESPALQLEIIKALMRFDRVEALPFLERIPVYSADKRVMKRSKQAIKYIQRNHKPEDMDAKESELLIAS